MFTSPKVDERTEKKNIKRHETRWCWTQILEWNFFGRIFPLLDKCENNFLSSSMKLCTKIILTFLLALRVSQDFLFFFSSGDVATSDILIPFKVNECKVLKPSSTHKTGLIYDRIRINCDFLWCARGKVIFVVDFIKYVAPLKSQILSQVENIFRHKIKSSIGPVIGSLSWEHRSQQKAEREDSNRQR